MASLNLKKFDMSKIGKGSVEGSGFLYYGEERQITGSTHRLCSQHAEKHSLLSSQQWNNKPHVGAS